jgi:hypothetical protein
MACSCDGGKDSRVSLDATRKALGAIRDFRIREDLLHFVSGAEVCLEHQEVCLALDCLRTVVTTVVALNRTLTPEITTGVLDGLLADSGTTAVPLRRGLGFTKNENMKCDIKTGTPIGSSSCVAQTNSTCYTLDSGSGCGGTSGFRFVWEIAS